MQTQAILKSSTLWTTPSLGIGADVQFTSLAHHGNSTYYPWIDDKFRPWIVQITDSGTTQITPLDEDPAMVFRNDSHHKASIGVDKLGYVHVIGGMHNGQSFITLPKYAGKSIMYWKSKSPNDISAGFDFVSDPANTPPGVAWTYGRFFYDSKGTMFYSSRVKAIEARHEAGEMGLGVYRYDETTNTWKALGAQPPNIRPGTYHKVLVWDVGGFAPDGWYQAFLSNLTFDKDDKLHMFTPINNDKTYAGNNSAVYAVSSDLGETWARIDGTPILQLPIRATQGLANSGDLVENYNGIPAPVADKNCVTVDPQGNPGVIMYTWKYWDGKSWNPNTGLNINRNVPNGQPGVPVPNYAYCNNKDTIVSIVSGNARICLSGSFADKPVGYDVQGFKSYMSVDEYALRKTGDIYGIGSTTEPATNSIIKTQIIPAPLPSGWTNADIGPIQPLYSSMSGFLDNEIVSTYYGGIIDGADDSFHYVYKKMPADKDCSLVALIDCTYLSSHALVGLMARQSLASNSLYGLIGTVPGDGYSTVRLRNTFNTYKYTMPMDGSRPLWVKMDYIGITDGSTSGSLKMYISTNGTDWTLHTNGFIGLDNIVDNSYYIGFASISSHRYGMSRASFKNIKFNGQNL